MLTLRFRIGLAFALLSAATVGAVETGGPKGEVLNCGDPTNKAICRECCADFDCTGVPGNHVFCCLSDCTVVNVPLKSTGLRIRVGFSLGALNIQLDRDGGVTSDQRPFSTVKLKETIALTSGKETVSLKTRLVGADSAIGGLLFPVAYLGLGSGALAALQGQGLDVAFLGDAPTGVCTDVFPADVCTGFANGLSAAIDSALATGDGSERSAFLGKVQMLGYAPCQPTTTTTSTSSTTSSACPSGQTRCSGVCVDTSMDDNNCGGCGTVCPSNDPVCIGSVCTIP